MILCSSGAFFHRGTDGRLFVPGDSDVDAVIRWGNEVPVDGIEILITRRMLTELEDAAARLADVGLRYPVVHGPKRVGAALPDPDAVEVLARSARFASTIGASIMVIHLWDLPDGDARFDERLRALRVAADTVADHGVALAVETIPCIVGTPLKNIERVLNHDERVFVALDTEFLALHKEFDSALAADWLWREDRVAHVHIKDFSGSLVDRFGQRHYQLPGEGTLDFDSLFETLEQKRFSGAVSLEASAHHLDGAPDVDRLSQAIRRMSHSPWRYGAP